MTVTETTPAAIEDTPVAEDATAGAPEAAAAPAVVEDVLVEEISIDGMCGVY